MFKVGDKVKLKSSPILRVHEGYGEEGTIVEDKNEFDCYWVKFPSCTIPVYITRLMKLNEQLLFSFMMD